MSAVVRTAAYASGAVVVLLAILAVAAFVAPHAGSEPAPAPGPAPTVAARGRQDRTCPHCRAWFNTERDQAAHERDCDQKPEQS